MSETFQKYFRVLMENNCSVSNLLKYFKLFTLWPQLCCLLSYTADVSKFWQIFWDVEITWWNCHRDDSQFGDRMSHRLSVSGCHFILGNTSVEFCRILDRLADQSRWRASFLMPPILLYLWDLTVVGLWLYIGNLTLENLQKLGLPQTVIQW